MDSLFSIMADNPEQRAELGTQLKELIPLSGQPTGFFMANLIVDELGKETLIETVGNPFAFFVKYNQAANKKRADTPIFSPKSIAFIKKLEKRYID